MSIHTDYDEKRDELRDMLNSKYVKYIILSILVGLSPILIVALIGFLLIILSVR